MLIKPKGMRNLVRFPKIIEALTQSPKFLGQNLPPQAIELFTTLGPFFRISPLHVEVAKHYFPDPKTTDKGKIANVQGVLRSILQTHQQELFEISDAIIKTAGKEPRERMLDWFALCNNANHKRRATRVDEKSVSSDGFMVNVTVRSSCLSTERHSLTTI